MSNRYFQNFPEINYNLESEKIVTIKDASGVSPNRSEIIAYNAWDWAQAIWHDMLS